MKADKLKGAVKFFSNKNNLLLALILIIGIILMSAAPLTKVGDDEQKQLITADTAKEEARLAAVLSRIEGAGAVEVMISYYGSSKKDLAYEVKRQSKDGSVSGGADESEDTKAVISGGAPVVVAEQNPKVRGVIVVAQGAGEIEVKRALSEAVTAVTGAPACNVRVYEMKGK